MAIETEVWNRACSADGDEGLLEGDRALRYAIAFTGFAENGGFAHALEVSGLDESVQAAGGLRFFGLNPAAALIDEAVGVVGAEVLALDDDARQEAFHRRLDLEADPLETLEERFGEVGDQQHLQDAFERHFSSSPEAFATPLGTAGEPTPEPQRWWSRKRT